MHGWDRRHNTSRAKRLTWRQRQWTVRHAALPRRTCPWPAACKWAGVSSQSPATETLPSPCQEQYSRDCLGAGMKSKAVQCDHGREHAAPWRTLTASSLLVQRSTPAIIPPLNRSGADGIAPAFMFHDAVGAAAAFMFNDAAGAAASATSSSAAHSVRRAILSLRRTRQVLYLLARPLVEFAGYKPPVSSRLPAHGFICTNVSLGVVWCAEKGPRHKRLIGLGSRAGAGVTGRRVGHPAFSRGSPGRKQERDVGVHQNQPSDCNFTASRTELHSKIGAVIKVLEIR